MQMVSHIVGYAALLYYPVLAFLTLASLIVYQFIVRSELSIRGYNCHNAFRKITLYRQIIRCLSKLPQKSIKRFILSLFLAYQRFVLRNTLMTLTGGLLLGGIAFVLSIIGI